MSPDDILHVLRNPYVKSETEIRDARIAGADLIEALRNPWVSVKERLPKDGQVVLAINAKHSRRHAVMRYIAHGQDFPHTVYEGDFASWLEEAADYCVIEVPTHWMPLPTPPIPDEQDKP